MCKKFNFRTQAIKFKKSADSRKSFSFMSLNNFNQTLRKMNGISLDNFDITNILRNLIWFNNPNPCNSLFFNILQIILKLNNEITNIFFFLVEAFFFNQLHKGGEVFH